MLASLLSFLLFLGLSLLLVLGLFALVVLVAAVVEMRTFPKIFVRGRSGKSHSKQLWKTIF